MDLGNIVAATLLSPVATRTVRRAKRKTSTPDCDRQPPLSRAADAARTGDKSVAATIDMWATSDLYEGTGCGDGA
jgi:hypothetical protein